MLHLVAWLIVGGSVGWIAGLLLRVRTPRSRWLNVGVGVIGAMLAGFWVAPLIADSAGAHQLPGIDAVAVASLGAAVLLIVVNAVPRLRRRRLH